MNSDRVLMIGWEYPPHNSGGLGVACQGVTKALSGQNTQIYFTLPFDFSHDVDHMNVLNCFDADWTEQQYPPFDPYHPQTKINNNSAIDAFDLGSLHKSEMERKVEEYAELVANKASKISNKFDVVHAHDWMSFPAAIKIKQKIGKPIIAHVHSTEFDRVPNGYGSPYINKVEKQGLEIADQIIAVSNYTKHLLINKYDIDSKKVHVVHNGINSLNISKPKKNHFAKKRPVVVFMGRLTMQKGVDHFLKMSRNVLKTMPEVLFIVAGSGHLYHELLFQTAGQRLSASVLFSGFVRDKQRDKLLDRADVFVMPSISEPFGLVALEAAQRHTPVIVSKTAGVSEVMSNALAVDFWDINAMSKSIINLLTDKNHHSAVTKGQLGDVSNVNWSHAADKVKAVYRKAFLGSR